MPAMIPACTVVATKQASGGVRLDFIINGAIRFSQSILAADFTSFNTTVNGGATGATLTRNYAQDAAPADYPLEYVAGV
jgi:hypothetical protein